MSYSGDIMATGEARLIREENPQAKIAFGNPEKLTQGNGEKAKLYWSEVFENNPNILQPKENAEEIIIVSNYPALRPYINYAKSRYAQSNTHKQSILKIAYNADFTATRGELFFTEEELKKAEELIGGIDTPIIVIDPIPGTPNKSWPRERWEEVIQRSSYTFVQLCFEDRATILDGVVRIDSETFRLACAVLKACAGRGIFLGIDGDLHHAAAAVGLPAIVLWSHYSHPDNLGYDDHINIRWDAAGKPCGLRGPCAQCERAMKMIHAEDVMMAIDMLIKPQS